MILNLQLKKCDLIELKYAQKYEVTIGHEFYGKPGQQHYQLLAHLSTLYNDTYIIDIGTHNGHSALALSYNESNTVYSYDIIPKLQNSPINNRDNIEFRIENLLNETGLEKNKDFILKCPMIFLDVDPHDGMVEYKFLKYLEKNQYKGIVVCDDIWYFKPMRDKFWYQIPGKYKTDISDYGHFSGTGIISYHQKIKIGLEDTLNLNKEHPKSWTVVTAYFDLTKCTDASRTIKDRPLKHYLDNANTTMSLEQNLVVYCEKDNYEKLKSLRPKHLHHRTKYVVMRFDDFTFNKYRDKIAQNRKEKPYHFDERNIPSYYLFCMSRYEMIKRTIEENSFNSTHFCWLNICIERMGYQNAKYLNDVFSIYRDKFSTCYIDYIPPELVNNDQEFWKFGRCSMCSGFFTGKAKYFYKFCNEIQQKFLKYLELGYGHADEQLYSPVYFDHPDIFDWYLGDYFEMVSNYKYVRVNAHKPVNLLIKKSFTYKNYSVTARGCEIMWGSILKGKCELDQTHFIKLVKYTLYSYALTGKKVNKEILKYINDNNLILF